MLLQLAGQFIKPWALARAFMQKIVERLHFGCNARRPGLAQAWHNLPDSRQAAVPCPVVMADAWRRAVAHLAQRTLHTLPFRGRQGGLGRQCG